VRVKICGITQVEQGRAIAQLGADALGFICVANSPRYVLPAQIHRIVDALPRGEGGISCCDRVGVFVNASVAHICEVVTEGNLNIVQLHGGESPDFCVRLYEHLPPGSQIIKALRIRTSADLEQAGLYANAVDMLLLDAYHPAAFGGTGHTLDWPQLQQFRPSCPWFLAGGLTAANLPQALSLLHPDGIDLSSGVERSPGDKDLDKVEALFQTLRQSGSPAVGV
jgi:phosphoribosylanthranilate isomerase